MEGVIDFGKGETLLYIICFATYFSLSYTFSHGYNLPIKQKQLFAKIHDENNNN